MSPLPHIPSAKERAVPQFQVRGTNDPLVLHDDAQEFLEALVKVGQRRSAAAALRVAWRQTTLQPEQIARLVD